MNRLPIAVRRTILAFGATFVPFLRLKDRFIAGSRGQSSETGMSSIVAEMREAGASGDAVKLDVSRVLVK
jgi:hypothetical protein